MQSSFPRILLLFLANLMLSHGEGDLIHTIKYDADTFNKEISQRNHFVMFYAPWCIHCQKLTPTWERLAEMLNEEDIIRIARVDCTTDNSVCIDEDITGYPTLKFYRIGENEAIKFRGTRDLPSLTSFINNQLRTAEEMEAFAKNLPEPIAGLIELSESNYVNALARGKYFVKFYAPWCGHCQKLAPVWDQLAKSLEFETDISIAKMDCTQNHDVCNHFEIKGYPTLLWMENGRKVDKYQGQRTHDDLKSYVNKMLGTDGPKVEEAVSQVTDSISSNMVLILNGDNFRTGIEKGITFVKFFAPWCGHCKRLAPTWEALGKKFVGNNDVNIVKIDCTLDVNKQLCSDEEVDGFPSIFLYRNGQKISEYTGNRNLDDLYGFVLTSINEHDEL